jgi:hypothetical protein
MEDIGCSFVGASLIPPRKRTTLSLPRKEPLCQKWSRLLAPDGMLRNILKTGKISAWTKTRVRSFIGWYRHITLVLLALAYLAGICATERFPTGHPTTSEAATQPSVLPLTIRCQCAICSHGSSGLCLRPHTECLDAAWWRRCHQSAASYYHTKRRLKAG